MVIFVDPKNTVKASAAIKFMIPFAGMVILMTAQWRTAARLRQENRELQAVREQAEQTRAEFEQAAQHESEAQSLKAEVINLRDELQTVRHELEQAKTSAVQPAIPAVPAPGRFGSASASSLPQVDGAFLASLHKRERYHMWPTVRTNLSPLPRDDVRAYSAYFWLDDVELGSDISREALLASPDWTPSQPLPLSFTEAEQVARQELGRLVHNESAWEVCDIHLHHHTDQKWAYSVTLMPTGRPGYVEHPDYFTAHIDLSGKPGSIGLRPVSK